MTPVHDRLSVSDVPWTPPEGCLSLTHLLDGGGELQTQLDDSAFGRGEVVGARQRSPGKT